MTLATESRRLGSGALQNRGSIRPRSE